MKLFLRLMSVATTAAALFTLQGCLKDDCQQTFKLHTPIYKTLTQVRADMKSTTPQALKNTGKLTVFGTYIFLNEVGKGIHVIDNANPSVPKNIGFINIPDNVDIAVKGAYLFADSYSDVIVFDISNPTEVKPVKFMDNVMKERNRYWNNGATNTDMINVITGYTEKDTTVDCNTYNRWTSCASCSGDFSRSLASAAAPQISVGGSLASFTIVNDYLYTVGSQSLYCINISNPLAPQQTAEKNLGWGIETIYPFQNKLFIGSRSGMFIYDLSNPANPTAQGQFSHITRCDPVIADAQYAYVTLRGGTACNGVTSELDIIDVSDLSAPVLKGRHSLSNPYGLSKDGATLFVCDGKEGLKIYNAAAPLNLQLTKEIKGLEAYDVIAMKNNAIVVAKDGLYQYDYSNPANITQISKLSITKN